MPATCRCSSAVPSADVVAWQNGLAAFGDERPHAAFIRQRQHEIGSPLISGRPLVVPLHCAVALIACAAVLALASRGPHIKPAVSASRG